MTAHRPHGHLQREASYQPGQEQVWEQSSSGSPSLPRLEQLLSDPALPCQKPESGQQLSWPALPCPTPALGQAHFGPALPTLDPVQKLREPVPALQHRLHPLLGPGERTSEPARPWRTLGSHVGPQLLPAQWCLLLQSQPAAQEGCLGSTAEARTDGWSG